MRRRMMKSKIHRATVTDANLHYVGSITIDRDLMDAGRPARVRAGRRRRHRQRRPLRDLRHRGRAGLGRDLPQRRRRPPRAPGDKVIIISYADYEDAELRRLRADRSCTSTPPTGRSTRRWPARSPATAPGPRRYVERGRAGLQPVADRSMRGRTSTCSSSARASPGCRPRCGPPRRTACASACSPRRELHQATTRWAQGGVAAVLGGDDPTPPTSTSPTRWPPAPGCATSTRCACWSTRARRACNELIALGAMFDRDARRPARAGPRGRPLAGPRRARRRRGHRRRDRAGARRGGARARRPRSTSAAFALDLIVEGGRCRGVVAARRRRATRTRCGPRNVLVATGGAGQLFAVTTNPAEATGDGIAMALRAGVAVADVEFVQFHPTALHHPAMPRPLLSEALRGHGALLRDAQRRAVRRRAAARATRSSRAMTAPHARAGRRPPVARRHRPRALRRAVPDDRRGARARSASTRPRDWLPIAPAAHYLCGGIVADLDGASSLPGLWAAGEAACNGVHGANRLASNSLLDGMVFAPAGRRGDRAGQGGAGADRRHARGARRPRGRIGGIAAAGGCRPASSGTTRDDGHARRRCSAR